MSDLLADTSVIIDFLRAKSKKATLLYSLAKNYKLNVSIITHTELYAGKSVWEKPMARKELETLFSGIKILPLTQNVSRNAGRLRVKRGMNLFDAIVAATAISNKVELTTLNEKDFARIRGLKIFQKPN